jgi:acyl-CoA thioester hydrolase
MTSRTVETTLRVRFAETDAQAVVYHANYLIYFEIGRAEYLRARGFDYHAMEATGTNFVVAEARATYRAPLRYDDEIVVATRVAEVRHRSFTFDYEVRRGDALVATGTTAHVCVDGAGKAIAIPADLRALLEG